MSIPTEPSVDLQVSDPLDSATIDEVKEPVQTNDAEIDDSTKPMSDVIRPEDTCSLPSQIPARSASPPTLTMPTALTLPDLALHSPSSQIIGTPFATNSSRFEYPFPESSTPGESGSISGLPHSPSFPSLATGSTFPGPSASSSQPQSLSTTPPSMSHPPITLSPPLDLPNYSPAHPKLRAVNPPIPPGLVKKRQRWSLGLLLRRSSGSQSSEGSPLTSPASDGDRATGSGRESFFQRRRTIDSQPRHETVPEEGVKRKPPQI